jgi:hypothetical protein
MSGAALTSNAIASVAETIMRESDLLEGASLVGKQRLCTTN